MLRRRSESGHDFDVACPAARCRFRTAWVTSVRARDNVDHQHDHVGRLALLIHASTSSVAAAGETTAPSRMEQSVDVGRALLQLVQGSYRG
jgi:hypothetical protein